MTSSRRGGGARHHRRHAPGHRLRIAALVALGALAGPRGVTSQEETIRAVRMSVAVSGADAQVILEVDVDGAGAAATLPATILDFASARPIDLAVGSEGAPATLELDRGVARTGSLRVEPGPTDGSWLVLATYRVRDAVAVRGSSLRAHVPVLSVDRPPTAAGPGFFRAELRLPPEWAVTEGFPSGIRATDRPGVYDVDLSVVPAVLSFRGRVDGAWRPGVPVVLDLLAGALLVMFSVVGFRHLRAVAA